MTKLKDIYDVMDCFCEIILDKGEDFEIVTYNDPCQYFDYEVASVTALMDIKTKEPYISIIILEKN